eukprot:1147689-Pelagomonas_calceolata.AAC.7
MSHAGVYDMPLSRCPQKLKFSLPTRVNTLSVIKGIWRGKASACDRAFRPAVMTRKDQPASNRWADRAEYNKMLQQIFSDLKKD